ncbi:MAG: M14 family metallopeptidase [Myxococcota bacterium]
MSVADHSKGFREDYLSYADLTAQLQAWAKAYPHVCNLASLGTTPEGREIWILTLGTEPDRLRPAAWVDGNMHAVELAGSSAALAIAEDVLRVHAGEAIALPETLLDVLKEILVYVVPRISPDGAEAVLTTGRYVRSVPREERANREHARWVAKDLDGDGLALVMRKQDPAGEYVEAKEMPGLLVPRQIDDVGPFYKVFPEGVIENWDGSTIPDPNFLSDNDPDLNRNFPYHWAPEPDQIGAGRYPLSEIESRAIVEFVSARPAIFTWLNLHTFGGVFIRPHGAKPDSKMDPSDLAFYRQFEEWATEFTSYPTVSGYEEFTYEPDKPLHGDLSDFAYHQRGAISWVCEIWDLFERAGLPKKKRFVDRYTQIDRGDMVQIAEWDRDHNEGAVMRPWRPLTHPQIGEVEVGGIDPRFGMWNPPRRLLPEVCEGLAAVFLRTAILAPRVSIDDVEVTSVEGEVRHVQATIRNHGYLPTYVLSSSRSLSWNEPLALSIETEGCTLLGEERKTLGHLEGWGRGRWSGAGALYYQRSRGSVSERRVHFTVKGSGVVVLRATSCRVGEVVRSVEI